MGFLYQFSSTNSRWAWITCYSTNNRTSPSIWFKHGYFTIKYLTCSTTLGSFMFQNIQNYIRKGERWGHGKKMIIMNQTISCWVGG
jgi:hypothetical protein